MKTCLQQLFCISVFIDRAWGYMIITSVSEGFRKLSCCTSCRLPVWCDQLVLYYYQT